MKFLTIATLLTTTAVALPSSFSSPKAGDLTMRAGQNKCGSSAKLSCCDKKVDSGKGYETNKGLLSGSILGELLGSSKGGSAPGVFEQCKDMTGSSLLGLDDILSSQCSQSIACCDDSKADAHGGLINIALPCLVLQDLL